MIRAVVFDVYGTLFDTSAVVEACERAYPGQGDAVSKMWRQKQLEYTWLRTLMNSYADFSAVTRDALLFTLSSLNLNHKARIVKALSSEYLSLKPWPEASEALEALRPTKLAVLSNGTKKMLRELISKSQLGSYLKVIMSVEDIEKYKPNQDVYRIATRRLKLAKDEILFVSANSWDAIGAKRFGLRVAWVNRNRQRLDRLDFRPDNEVSSLTELAGIVSPMISKKNY